MRSSRAVLLAVVLWLPGLSAADCVQQSGAYESFHITRVTVETPLRFPVHWIERSLLGPAIDSLDSVAGTLRVKKDGVFHFADHVATMSDIRDRYSVMKPGERIRLVLVLPEFTVCDLTARTVEVVYRVYTTDAAYFASRLLESANLLPDRSMTVDKASAKQGRILPVPFAGYDRSRQLFGGMKASWSGKGSLINSSSVEAAGSSSSYQAAFSLGGSRDPENGRFSHFEWKTGYQSSQDPAGILSLTKSFATAQAFAATRASGPLGIMFRFGSSIEAGRVSAGTSSPGALSSAPQRVLKSFAGATWSYNRQIWNASYGFQLGRGTSQTPVDYTKHLIDVAHQVRFLPWEHWPIQVDSHFNAGWIRGSQAEIPVAERFFGGNFPGDFLDNPLWRFPSNPLLRSFPHNLLNTTGPGLPIGGTSFEAVNVTAAFPVWAYPAMPALIRHAKPLEDGIHLGLQAAQSASLEDFRARTNLFPGVLKRAVAVTPDLEKLRDRLSPLTKKGLPDRLTSDLNDLLDHYIGPTLADLAKAQMVPTNGLAWSICRKLSKDDPDTYPLAHLSDDLTHVVAPGLDTAGLTDDAAFVRAMVKTLDRDKNDIAALLAPIEPLVLVPQSSLNTFQGDLASLSKLAQNLKNESAAFLGSEAPLGTLAFDVTERSTSLINATADPGPDPDPFDSLYVLGRLSVGIGKLVPPQIESAALAADLLAAAIPKDHLAESGRISQLAKDLRASLASIQPRLAAISVPAGERWARQQNQYFVRALDVAFREMNLGTVSPVLVFDAARIGPQPAGVPTLRYGIGPGIRFSIVSFQVTLGYSFNPNPQPLEKRGAFFFSMDVIDLFR
jgi:hypothetical protein